MAYIDPGKLIIRTMKSDDVKEIIEIDESVFGLRRENYYERKAAHLLDNVQQLVTSLVAISGERLVGFIMGNLYMGEYGIPESTASLDTIGVHPDFQKRGVGKALVKNYISYIKKAGVEHIYILVEWNNWEMLKLFEGFGFQPEPILNLGLKLA